MGMGLAGSDGRQEGCMGEVEDNDGLGWDGRTEDYGGPVFRSFIKRRKLLDLERFERKHIRANTI